jgi:tubulin polyglutamylase TTLL6/13
MHLTNYAINKSSSKFEFNQSLERMDIGHKRSLSSILQKLKEMNQDS